MSRRSVRLLLLLLAFAATGAAAYRGFENERSRQNLRTSARVSDRAAEDALVAIADLRASLHAYVAEGQGEAFWGARVATLFDTIRTDLLKMDGARAGDSTGDMLDR